MNATFDPRENGPKLALFVRVDVFFNAMSVRKIRGFWVAVLGVRAIGAAVAEVRRW